MTNKSLLASQRLHLIMGGVSLWTRPPAPAPVVQGPKTHPIRLITTTMSCPMSARQRACQQPCPGPPGNDDFLNSGNCEISTVSTTKAPGNTNVLNESNGEVSTVSSTTAPGTCKPAKQGHNVDHLINVLQLESHKVKRTMRICICATTGMTTSCTVGSRLSSNRQQRRNCTTCKKGHRPPGIVHNNGKKRRDRNCNCGHHRFSARLDHHPGNCTTCTTGKSITASSNRGISWSQGPWGSASAQ